MHSCNQWFSIHTLIDSTHAHTQQQATAVSMKHTGKIQYAKRKQADATFCPVAVFMDVALVSVGLSQPPGQKARKLHYCRYNNPFRLVLWRKSIHKGKTKYYKLQGSPKLRANFSLGAIKKCNYYNTKWEKMSIKINRVWDIIGKRVMTYMPQWCDLYAIEDLPASIGDWSSVAMVSWGEKGAQMRLGWWRRSEQIIGTSSEMSIILKYAGGGHHVGQIQWKESGLLNWIN